MIQKLTLLNVCSTTRFIKLKTFHVYKKGKVDNSFIFTKNSIKSTLKKDYSLLGKKTFSLFLKPKFFLKKTDGSFIGFLKNQTLPMKKKRRILGGFVIGPCFYKTGFLKIKNKFACSI